MSHFEWENIDINAGNVVSGIISNIDYKNLTADVEGIGIGLPIHYHCEEDAIDDTGHSYDVDYPDEQDEEGANAFSEDDEVLVMYRRVNNEEPVIVGFPGEALNCLGEYTFISLSFSDKIDRCIVWNIRANRLATDVTLNAVGEEEPLLAIFPCHPDNISDWLDKHVNVGEELYSGLSAQAGEETQETCICDAPSPCDGWWDEGVCHDDISLLSNCVGQQGEDLYTTCDFYVARNCSPCTYSGLQASGINESYYTMPAMKRTIKTFPSPYWNQGLMGSYSLQASNMTEMTKTCLRHQVDSEYIRTYHCAEDLAVGCSPYDEDSAIGVETHTFIAPFAIMGSVDEDYNYVARPWEDPQIGTEMDEGVFAPGTTPTPEDSRIKRAKYSDRSMVQIFFYEALFFNRTRPCAYSWCMGGWSGGSPEYGCEWTVNNKTRHTFIAAHANDFFSQGGTEDVDPREVGRQSNFEEAVLALLEDFYDFNGATSEEIWDFETEVSIRDKDEITP